MGLQAVYKKLMQEDVSLKDLQDLQPQLARGFEQLLEFEGDVADTFCQTFQVTHGSNCFIFLQGVKIGMLLGTCYCESSFQINRLFWGLFVPQLDFQIPDGIGAEHFSCIVAFQVTYEYFGEMKTYDLIEGGGDVIVTNENRERYCSDMDPLYLIVNIFTFLFILAGVREENYKVSCFPY